MNANDHDIAKLKADIDTLRKDFSTVADTLKQLSTEQARESVARVRQHAEKTTRQIEEEIQKRPITGMVTAFGVGFILAKLLDR